MRGSPVLLIPQQPLLRGLVCLSCGARFRRDQVADHERHVVGCSNRHVDEERQMSARATGSVFGGDMVIPDLEAWVSRNRTELIEKRKKL